MAPYEKRLQDYVPTWIANIEKSVPTNSYTINTAQALDRSSGVDDKSKDQDKSFLENMRAFLGLE